MVRKLNLSYTKDSKITAFEIRISNNISNLAQYFPTYVI